MPRHFTLRCIVWADGQQSLDREDFCVRNCERAVGRVYHTAGGARGDGYAWFIYGSSRNGFAQTREAAAVEWKEAYARFLDDRR